MTNPASRGAGDQVRLKEILARCPELEATAGHVNAFATMTEGSQRSRRARSTRSSVWCAPAPPSGAMRGRCSSICRKIET